MIYTAPCVMFLMRADTSRGEVVGGLALEISSFVGPCEMARADRRVPFGAICMMPFVFCKIRYSGIDVNEACNGGSAVQVAKMEGWAQ
jgi:hypothetical protein